MLAQAELDLRDALQIALETYTLSHEMYFFPQGLNIDPFICPLKKDRWTNPSSILLDYIRQSPHPPVPIASPRIWTAWHTHKPFRVGAKN